MKNCNTKEKIEIMQWFLDGNDVEVCAISSNGIKWIKLDRETEPSWNWASFEYRKVIKPKEIFMVTYQNGDTSLHTSEIEARDTAELYYAPKYGYYKITKFIEVIDEN